MNHPGIERIRELDEIEDKVMLGFSFSDAIRIGAQVTGQARGEFLTDDNACAISAAYLTAKALRLE